jgi:alkylation response protein AidB-like acyl-CoA dehydrogenase
MDAADRELFTDSIRRAAERGVGGSLDAALDEIGWRDALVSDPHDAVEVLFEQQGLACATSSALDDVLLSALGKEPATASVVLARDGGPEPAASADDDPLRIRGLGSNALTTRASALVVARDGDKQVAGVIPRSELTVRPIGGIDPAYGLVEVDAQIASAELEPVDWSTAVARGQLALAHELVGASRKMLALAREHALQREQFGQPISRFQAVRHRLADTLVAIESAEAVLDAAWEDLSAETAAMAKAVAGRSARTTTRHCQQVLAGIGFTKEHSLHLYIRRALVLDQLLGSSRALTEQQGRRILETRQLPPLSPL